MDLTRIWIGPLPNYICDLQILTKNTIVMAWIMIQTCSIVIRYIIMCVLKSMPDIKDNQWTKVIVSASWLVSFLLSLMKVIPVRKPLMAKIICSGTFYASLNQLDKPVPIFQIVAGISFLLHVVLWIPIFKRRRQIEVQDNDHPGNQVPQSLESLAVNLLNTILMLMVSYGTSKMNRINPGSLEEYPNWLFPFFNYFVAPTLLVWITAVKIVVKNGKEIHKKLFRFDVHPA